MQFTNEPAKLLFFFDIDNNRSVFFVFFALNMVFTCAHEEKCVPLYAKF